MRKFVSLGMFAVSFGALFVTAVSGKIPCCCCPF